MLLCYKLIVFCKPSAFLDNLQIQYLSNELKFHFSKLERYKIGMGIVSINLPHSISPAFINKSFIT